MEKSLRHILLCLGALNIASCQKADRIVGGQDGDITSFPWQVSLWYNSQHACGASLISAQWLLSAAHCFPVEHSITDYTVVVGTTTLTNPGPDVQSVMIDSVYKNPAYTPDAYSWDIALVKLKSPVTFSNTVQPIRLPSASVQFPAGMQCSITGWGNTKPSVNLGGQQTLQVGKVTIISRRTCSCLYGINPTPETLTIQADMMCAGTTDGSVDACQGDSGGPLSCYTNNNWYQAAIVSWGDVCGTPNRPGVYISVPAYSSWIAGYNTGAQIDDFVVNTPPVADGESGCTGADGEIYPYPNGATVVLVTFAALPLYWLTAYLLTDL
ncbi:prostasin-like [Pseudophryne corroboree]|uniref:prostasin-like n=1 Tax=Pseudophryne corroboree TaxID=495146 RepID=UPI00308206AB